MIQACEERLVNAWPALQTLAVGDWLVRMADGYSGRANSACAIRPDAQLDAGEMEAIITLYERAGLRPAFRITPLVSAKARNRLHRAGFAPQDPSIGMVAPVLKGDLPGELVIEAAPTSAWVVGVAQWQVGIKQNVETLGRIVGTIRLPAAYATLYQGDARVAHALCAIDRGMAEIGTVMVAPTWRGKGMGRALVSGLMIWAGRNGADTVFLQVASDNAVAHALYRSLGFEDCYLADYWRRG
jgi:N-acetylglutamate synthase